MALAVSLLTSGVSTTDSTTFVTASVSPAANSYLLMVCFWDYVSTILSSSCSSTLSGMGTWTELEVNGANSPYTGVAVWRSQCGASPGSGTVTVTMNANCPRRTWHLLQITGHNTTTPVQQTKTGSGTGTSLTVTLDSTPAASSMVVAAIGSADRNTAITPPTNHTELADTGSNDGWDIRGESCYDLDSAAAAVAWASLSSGDQHVGVALEINLASTTPSPSVSDSVAVAESRTVSVQTSQVAKSESIGVAENVLVVIPIAGTLTVVVSDNVGISENVVAQIPAALSVNVSESVGVAEQVTIAQPTGTVTYIDGYGGDVESYDDNLLNSNGATYNLGAHNQFEFTDSDPQHSILRFNFSAIPAGSSCVSAVLSLMKTSSIGSLAVHAHIYSIAQANGNWQAGVQFLGLAAEDESCWNAKAADGAGGVKVAWAGGTNGCGISGTDYEVTQIGYWEWNTGDPADTVYNVELDTTRISGWFGASNTNYGIIIITHGGNGGDFGASDSTVAAERPKLTVEYTSSATGANVTDTIGVSESVNVAIASALAVNVSEAIGVSESASVAIPVSLSKSEAVGVSESVGAAVGISQVGKSESIGIAESVSATVGTPQVVTSEAIGVAESSSASVTAVGGITASTSDGVSVGESVTAAVSAPGIVASDNLGVAESVSVSVLAAGGMSASVTDSITLSESITVTVGSPQVTVTQSLSVSESVLASVLAAGAVAASVTDSISIAENITVTVGSPQINTSESITLSESVSAAVLAAGALAISVSDTVTLSEAVSLSVSASQVTVSDSIGISESTSLAVSVSQINVSDSVTVTDNTSAYSGEYIGIVHWTLKERPLDWTLNERNISWILKERNTSWTVREK